MLGELLFNGGVRGAAALPAAVCPLRLPRLLEGVPAQTVIVLTVPYRTGRDTGRLAAFAAARDYHVFFSGLFRAAAAEVSARYPGASVRGFADHSPYAEVRLAAMAGLGIRGDNGLLLTPEYGSFVVIGELVTELSPEACRAEGIPYRETPAAVLSCEHCGACGAACPGGCLPGTDRASCASALSQKKAPLTEAEKEILRRGGYVWGCDACQMACPRNRQAKLCPAGWFTRELLPGITREMLDGMSEEEFRARAFGWRPRAVLLRNLEEEGHD